MEIKSVICEYLYQIFKVDEGKLRFVENVGSHEVKIFSSFYFVQKLFR